MRTLSRTAVLLAMLAVFSCAAVSPAAWAAPAQDRGTISMDFNNVDLQVLIKFISEVTGRNFIVDNKVQGKVTIYSPMKISPEEAYQVFESVLMVHGFAITKAGSVYKILPSADARVGAGKPFSEGTMAGGRGQDGLVTQVVTLKNSSAAELVKLLPQMLGPSGIVNVYQPTNTLILTAPRINVEQVLRIVEIVDRSLYTPAMKTFQLQFGDSKTVAASINKLLTTQAAEQEKLGKRSFAMVQEDARTNTLIALADPESMRFIQTMLDVMDIPTPKGKGDIHMLRLMNADAEDVAKVINSLVERQGKTEEEKILSRDVKIVADDATNSLIITARPDDFDILRSTIAGLDVERKQVFIEALIMEASSDASFSFGVNWAAGRIVGSGTEAFLFGSSNLGGGTVGFPSDPDAGTISFPSGGTLGALFDDAVTIGGTAYSIQAILSAIRGDNQYTILATPQLLTLDNEEAQVNVVNNVPFAKESTTSNVNQDYNSVTIDYKDVGVKLKITPHISENNTLRLEIEQEVSRVISSLVTVSDDQQIIAPTTRKREVQTSIRMRDGQTAVIAGLLSEDDSDSAGQIPGLGDIPVLGWLFKNKTESRTNTNLYIFITPRIIGTFEESERLAKEKSKVLHEQQVGTDGLGLPVVGQPRMLSPVRVVGQ